jgi:hypothetical protein
MKYNHIDMLPEQAFRPVGKKMTFEGGGGSSGSSKTVSEIPEELKPLAERYSQAGIELFDTPFQEYTAKRFAELNPTQMQGINMITDRAKNGSATVDNAESALNQIINGSANPYLDAMFDAASGKVSSAVNGNFALGGRYGSGAHTGTLADSLGNLAANMYGNAYENDAARRMQAIGMAPEFGNLAYNDANQILRAGQIQQDQSQQQLDFNYQQFLDEQMKTYNDMAAAAGVFQSQPYGSSSTTKSSGGGK